MAGPSISSAQLVLVGRDGGALGRSDAQDRLAHRSVVVHELTDPDAEARQPRPAACRSHAYVEAGVGAQAPAPEKLRRELVDEDG